MAVTTGIRRLLTDRELRAVIGHEIGHVKNRDILLSSIAATIAGAISYIQTMLMWGAIFGGGRDRRWRHHDRLPGFDRRGLCGCDPPDGALEDSRVRRRQERRRVHARPESLASALGKLHNGVQAGRWSKKAGTEATSSLYIVHRSGAAPACRTCSPPTRRSRSASGACGGWRGTWSSSQLSAVSFQPTEAAAKRPPLSLFWRLAGFPEGAKGVRFLLARSSELAARSSRAP